MNRRPPPPGIAAAAEQDLHGARVVLTDLVGKVRGLLAEGMSQTDACIEVYLTLRAQSPGCAAVLGSVAVLRLATQPDPDRVGGWP